MPKPYDLVISGAGSGGLSLAIFRARKGQKVLVLEKQDRPGVFPRGETLRPDPIVQELLGKDFMDGISFNRTALRRYYSPLSRHSFSLEREHESYIFHWADLTRGLCEEAGKAGAEILFNQEVTAPIIRNGRCKGVSTRDGREVFAKTVAGAEGYDSVLGRYCGVNYNRLNCPILKKICRGVEGDYPGMEYFLLPPGTLEYAPDLPPAIAFIFPRGQGHAETGMILFSGLKTGKGRSSLSKTRLFEIFNRMGRTYPVFSDKVKNAQEDFRGISQIPMAGLHHPPSIVPGLLLMGDSIGLVEASGGCGIVATMKNADFIAGFLEKNASLEWDRNLMKKYNQGFAETEIYAHIRKKYNRVPLIMELAIGKKRPMFVYDLLWKIGGTVFKKV